MADLQQNSTYNTGDTPSLGNLGARIMDKGVTPLPRFTPNISQFGNIAGALEGSPGPVEGAPITQPEGRGPFPVPSDYPGFVAQRAGNTNFTWPAPNLPTTQIKSFPESTGVPGQYVVDTSQPGRTIKSDRGITPYERQLLLAGRSSDFYEVDHLIPIWAGGADTLANMQVLAMPEQLKKTKVQSVPYTLMTQGLITEQMAKMYALQWDKLDDTDIPEPTRGVLPVDEAKKIKARWDAQALEPVKTFDWRNPKQAWKNFTGSIPDATKKVAEDVARVAEPIPYVGEFAKGAVSGLSGGWVPYTPQEGSNMLEKGMGFLGMLAGTFVPVGLASQVVLRGAKAVGLATKASRAAKALKMGESNYQGVLTKIPQLQARQQMKEVVYNNILRGMIAPGVGFTAWGQLSPEGLAGELLDQEVANWTDRLWQDLAYSAAPLVPHIGSSVFGGLNQAQRVIRGSTKAAGKTVGGQIAAPFATDRNSLAQYATDSLKVGVAAGAIGMMANDSPQDVLLNAVLMGAMHGVGMRAASNNVAAAQKQLEQLVGDQAKVMAHNVLATHIPRLQNTKGNVTIPAATREEVLALRAEAMDNLTDLQKNGTITPEAFHQERTAIFAASKALEYEHLPENLLRLSLENDLVSLAKQSERLGAQNPLVPQSVYDAFSKVRQDANGLLKNSLESHSVNPPSGKFLTGSQRLSGATDEINPYEGLWKEYVEKLSTGNASPTLVGVLRDDMEPILKAVNNRITQAEIDANVKKPHSNPQNAVQVFAMSWDGSGTPTIFPVGWFPRRSHIAEDGTINSFNNAVERTPIGRKMKESGQKDPFKENPDINKDELALKMKKEGLDFIYMNLDRSRTGTAEGSGKSYVRVTLNDENWGRSRQDIHLVAPGTGTKSIPKIISDHNNTKNVKKAQATLKELREKTVEPADALLGRVDPTSGEVVPTPETVKLFAEHPAEMTALQTFVATAREVFSSATPRELATKMETNFGITMDDATAQALHDFAPNVRVADVFTLIYQKGSTGSKAIINETLKPFLESSEFVKSWPRGKTFHEMRVLGGMKRPLPEMDMATVVNNAETPAPITPEVPPMTTPEAPVAPTLPGMETPTQQPLMAKKPSSIITPEMVQPNGPPVAPSPMAARLVSEAQKVPREKPATPLIQKVPLTDPGTGEPITTQSQVSIQKVNPGEAGAAPIQKVDPRKEFVQGLAKNFAAASDDYETRAVELMDSEMVPKTREMYVAKLANVLNKLDPEGKIQDSVNSIPRSFNPREIAAIKNRVKSRLVMKAEDMVDRAFSQSNEIDFKVGSGASKELDAAMKLVIKLDTVKRLGDTEGAIQLLDDAITKGSISSGNEVDQISVFKRAAELLKNNAVLQLLPEEVAKKKAAADVPKASPDAKPKQEQFDALNAEREAVGKDRIKAIEDGKAILATGQGDKKYRYTEARLWEEVLPMFFGPNWKNDKMALRDIGSVWSDLGIKPNPVTGEKEIGRTSRFKNLFETIKTSDPKGKGRELMDKTHSKKWLMALGEGKEGKLRKIEAERSKEIAEAGGVTDTFEPALEMGAAGKDRKSTNFAKNADEGENLNVDGTDNVIGAEELEAGDLRLLSKTQMENIDAHDLWVSLYPGLHKAIITGKEATSRQAATDVTQQLLELIKTINKRARNSRSFGGNKKQISLKLMPAGDRRLYGTEGDRAAYYADNKKKTSELVNGLLKKIQKELEEGNIRRGSSAGNDS